MEPKIFIFVIASFNEPEYIDFIRLRKLQLQKYGVDHYFLFDDLPPPNYEFDSKDIYIPKEFIENKRADINPHMNPYMVIKFLKGLTKINEKEYDYIIRVNLSTFLNIPKLIVKLQDKPRTNFAMSNIIKQILPDWETYNNTYLILLSGTCMIMSSDIVGKLKTVKLTSPILYMHNDDTVLSHIIVSYDPVIDNEPMYYLHNEKTCPHEIFEKYCVYRIKNDWDRSIDIKHWKYLLKHIDNIEV